MIVRRAAAVVRGRRAELDHCPCSAQWQGRRAERFRDPDDRAKSRRWAIPGKRVPPGMGCAREARCLQFPHVPSQGLSSAASAQPDRAPGTAADTAAAAAASAGNGQARPPRTFRRVGTLLRARAHRRGVDRCRTPVRSRPVIRATIRLAVGHARGPASHRTIHRMRCGPDGAARNSTAPCTSHRCERIAGPFAAPLPSPGDRCRSVCRPSCRGQSGSRLPTP